MDTCAKLKRSFIIASERGVFCDNDRNRAANGDSIVLPLTISLPSGLEKTVPKGPRPKLVYFRGPCGAGAAVADDGRPTPGGAKLEAMLKELADAGEDLDVACSEGLLPTANLVEAMRGAVFCPVMPTATRQATAALPAAALSGCIPVFFGPPWHAMPLAGDIAYRSIAVFLEVTASGAVAQPAAGELHAPPPEGRLEPNTGVEGGIVKVATFSAAVEHLRSLSAEWIAELQAALAKERLKFYLPAPEGDVGAQSVAGEIIVRRMCEYATKLNAMLSERDAARAAANGTDMDVLPKLPQGTTKG